MSSKHRFVIGAEAFELDGQPIRILSGALHYFRIHPGLWRDRIHKAKMLGLNTIETYIAWNYHSPRSGEFHTDGPRDIGAFLDQVAEEGMHAIVRPGPYICAEWDNGGLPTWVTRSPDIRLRSSDPQFLSQIGEYFDQIAPILRPRLIDNGGPIILMQVENEYGAYGADTEYLARIVDMYRERGFDVPLTTVDQPFPPMLRDGRIDGAHMTGSFGSRAEERFGALRQFQPDGPLMCSEFWCGWFDSWGQPHHETGADRAAAELDSILTQGASVNIYMLHGGTNFGLTNGANDKGMYVPISTSYDYDAPLAEDGHPTAKYWAMREVLGHYTRLPTEEPPHERAAAPEPCGQFEPAADWRELLDEDAGVTGSATFDDLLHSGYLLYRTTIPGSGTVLRLADVRDRAQVFVDGMRVGTLQRDQHEQWLALPEAEGERILEVLVEDQGRVDYGQRLGEWKGLGPASLDGRRLSDWTTVPVRLDWALAGASRAGDDSTDNGSEVADSGIVEAHSGRDTHTGRDAHAGNDAHLRTIGSPLAGPVITAGSFTLDAPADLHLDTTGWGKGVAWVNDFCLGRYWSRGAQRTLYVPSPATRAGANTVTIFETEGMTPEFRFLPFPDLGFTEI